MGAEEIVRRIKVQGASLEAVGVPKANITVFVTSKLRERIFRGYPRGIGYLWPIGSTIGGYRMRIYDSNEAFPYEWFVGVYHSTLEYGEELEEEQPRPPEAETSATTPTITVNWSAENVRANIDAWFRPTSSSGTQS